MGPVSPEVTAIRSLAVHGEDVVTALEARSRSGRDTVLRVTPPFSGRMRARLHEAGTDEYDDPHPLHLDPARFVAESAPDYPTPDATAQRLRDDPDLEYSRDRHRDRHATAVAEWRETLPGHLVGSITVETTAGPHEIQITTLG